MSTLRQDQIETLRRLMDERWIREVAEIRSVAERSRDERLQQALVGRAADLLDEALMEASQRADYAIVRQDIEDVRDIEAARSRILTGTYGVCADCGDEIDYERLLAYPTAKRCIDCQREHERKESPRQERAP